MICYLVEGSSVKSINLSPSATDNHTLRKWRKSVRGRKVYVKNSDLWYLMSERGLWNSLPKPDVISMAELLNAIQPISYKELQSGISSDSFWTE